MAASELYLVLLALSNADPYSSDFQEIGRASAIVSCTMHLQTGVDLCTSSERVLYGCKRFFIDVTDEVCG
jgi:hypothetical protein